jgi:RpiB/LacA/LacB family sugar-phosphate isomerase
MRIAIGSDHVGYPLKAAVADYLRSLNIEVIDQGTFNDQEAVDYPDFARKVAMAVTSGACERGVVICGTGVGVSIAVNKFPGIRAVLCDNTYIARQSRIHNDANVIAMGALVTTPTLACHYLDTWLQTDFAGGRHTPRLAKLDRAFQSGWPELDGLDRNKLQLGIALSPRKTVFGPLMYAGDLTGGLRAAAEAGFDAVELSLRAPGDLEVPALRKELQALGLTVSAIATGQSCLHDGLCLASPLEEKRAGVVERIKGHIDFAAAFGAKVIIGGIRGKLTGTPEEQASQKDTGMAALSECVAYAHEKGVQLVLEPINRYETNWINTVQDGLDVIDQIGMPDLRLVPDTFHMNIEERDISLALVAAGAHIGYMHFADNNRLAPGQGHIPFAAVIKTLCHIGYTGTITTEVLPLPADKAAMQHAAGFLRGLLNR